MAAGPPRLPAERCCTEVLKGSACGQWWDAMCCEKDWLNSILFRCLPQSDVCAARSVACCVVAYAWSMITIQSTSSLVRCSRPIPRVHSVRRSLANTTPCCGLYAGLVTLLSALACVALTGSKGWTARAGAGLVGFAAFTMCALSVVPGRARVYTDQRRPFLVRVSVSTSVPGRRPQVE